LQDAGFTGAVGAYDHGQRFKLHAYILKALKVTHMQPS